MLTCVQAATRTNAHGKLPVAGAPRCKYPPKMKKCWIGVSLLLLWGKTLTIYVLIWLWLRWTRITVTVQPFDKREEQNIELLTSFHWNVCIPASTGGFLYFSPASESQPTSEFALSLAVMQEFHPDLTVLKDQCLSSQYVRSSVNPKEMRRTSAGINTKWLKSYFFLP